MFSYQLPATLSANTGIHPSQSKAKWEGITPCTPANWNHSLHRALMYCCWDVLLLRTDVMAHHDIHSYQTSTWFDEAGRGEKICRDQQKFKLEPVLMSRSFCDLDRTSTFAEVQYPQLLVTSSSTPPKGSAARKSASKQTEQTNRAHKLFCLCQTFLGKLPV